MPPARYILHLSSDTAELWRRRGRVLDRIATLQTKSQDYTTQLRKLLVKERAYTLSLLLFLPNIEIRNEPLPALGRLDRRQFLRRRLDYLFPHAYLRGLKENTDCCWLVGMSAQPVLNATITAVIACKARIDSITHAGLELSRLLPQIRHAGYIVIARYGTAALLIAGIGHRLHTIRLLNDDKLADDRIAEAIRSTREYLQRHGLQSDQGVEFISFDLVIPTDVQPLFKSTTIYEAVNVPAELLSLGATSRPVLRLRHQVIQRLSRLWLMKAAVQISASLTAIVMIVTIMLYSYVHHKLDRAEQQLAAELQSLPPSLLIQDKALLQRLHAVFIAPQILTNIAVEETTGRLSYEVGALEKITNPTLRLTTATPPAIGEGWILKASPTAGPISGATDAKPSTRIQTYDYEYKGAK